MKAFAFPATFAGLALAAALTAAPVQAGPFTPGSALSTTSALNTTLASSNEQRAGVQLVHSRRARGHPHRAYRTYRRPHAHGYFRYSYPRTYGYPYYYGTPYRYPRYRYNGYGYRYRYGGPSFSFGFRY
jgi:hypothetical protein